MGIGARPRSRRVPSSEAELRALVKTHSERYWAMQEVGRQLEKEYEQARRVFATHRHAANVEIRRLNAEVIQLARAGEGKASEAKRQEALAIQRRREQKERELRDLERRRSQHQREFEKQTRITQRYQHALEDLVGPPPLTPGFVARTPLSRASSPVNQDAGGPEHEKTPPKP